jgi:hypothetical protein
MNEYVGQLGQLATGEILNPNNATHHGIRAGILSC